MKISINIPIYNEEGNIKILYERILSTIESIDLDAEIIFVNDGSNDGSAETIDALARRDERVRAIHLRRNYGQSAALMAAFDNSGGDVIITMDGDLQNDPEDIPSLLNKLNEGFDVVSGWRKDRKENWLIRRLPSRIASWLLSRLSGMKLHDFGCTLKAYRRPVIDEVQLYGEMHRFIPVFAAWQGAKVAELTVRDHPRTHGHSKYGMARIPRVFLDFILIYFLQKALDRPMQFFGRAGLYSFLVALVAGIFAIYLRWFEDTSFIQTPLPLLVVMLGICGVLCVLLGLVGEMLTRIYFEGQGKRPYVIRKTQNPIQE